MAGEKVDFGSSISRAVIRTPVLRIQIVRWDWATSKPKDPKPIDITHAVINFRWMKSLRNPEAGCDISMIPQQGDIHYLDSLNPMDVVQIYEFDKLKYQGFIRRIGASGAIGQDGKPSRTVSLTCSSFGALFSEGELGVNYFVRIGQEQNLSAAITEFQKTLADLIAADKSYSDYVTAIIDEWFKFLDQCGASKYHAYFDYWVNYSDAMKGQAIPGVPKDFNMFYSSEQRVTLWEIIMKIVQIPFNEIWFDCGPRKVFVENNQSASGKPGEVSMNDEKEYLIIRSTPYNGTVMAGSTQDLWDAMPSKKIQLSYLIRFDLNKTMDESYSFYLVSPSVYDIGIYGMLATGKGEFDNDAFDKYLFKPMMQNLFYSRIQKPDSTDKADDKDAIYKDCGYKATTLMNWNKHNDQYLSGAFTFMVPSDPDIDPRIGDKLEIEGIPDAFFYVEGVSHSWSYGGALISNVSVTRGYGASKPIELKDRIFTRGKFTLGEKFK